MIQRFKILALVLVGAGGLAIAPSAMGGTVTVETVPRETVLTETLPAEPGTTDIEPIEVTPQDAGESTPELSLMGNLTVSVTGLADQEGSVCFKVFSSSQGFPNDNDSAVLRECRAIDALPLVITFADLPYGNYAVAVYHDANGDETLNRGAFGMPIEGYGFSNDAPAVTSPATFGDAMFLLAGSETAIEITMQYAN